MWGERAGVCITTVPCHLRISISGRGRAPPSHCFAVYISTAAVPDSMCTVIGVAYMVYIQLQPTNLEL